ncbi:hypothetical protein [Sorangium sp. So ce124]|uniref:hypothetical protein n=1 Tax=Sorangium sp. So ce124 TaxID=3133280 RepID=UPI003F612A8A
MVASLASTLSRAVAMGDEKAARVVYEAIGRLLGLPVAPEATTSLTYRAAGVPNVFIEVLILEVPAQPPRDLRSASIQELLREPDVGVLITPHILATPGVRAEIRLDAPGSMPFRFTAKPDLRARRHPLEGARQNTSTPPSSDFAPDPGRTAICTPPPEGCLATS